MKCNLCENELSDDERSRASSVMPVFCDRCISECRTNDLAAEELMRHVLNNPKARDAVAALCNAAAIFGVVEFRWKDGRFYRIERPLA